jgi:hypothetical protein
MGHAEGRMKLKVSEVFGVRKAYELHNYVVRQGIDDAFLLALEVGKHVSVFGSSKTGKSSLIEKNIGDAERLFVQCSNHWSYNDFIDAVLHAAFGRVETTSSFQTEETGESDAGVRFTSNLPYLKGALGAFFKKRASRVINTKDNNTYDLENPGDFVRLFSNLGYGRPGERSKSIYLIIDDFHRLKDEIQEKIAILSKMLFDNVNVVVIVVGIWAEENKLSSLCSELMGRCVDINCNIWSNENLIDVISNGCAMLNIEFPAGFAESIAKQSFGSVFIVQESCQEACRLVQIFEAQTEKVIIEKTINASEIVNNVTSSQCNFTDFHNKMTKLDGQDTIALFPYSIMLEKSGNQSLDMESLMSIFLAKFDTFEFERHFAENSCRRLDEIIQERNLGKIFDFHLDSRSKRYCISLVDPTLRFWLKGRRKHFTPDILDRIEKQMQNSSISGVSLKKNKIA